MSNSLSYYKLREFLSLHEATSLVLESDPNDNWVPDGYDAMYSLLEEAVMADLVKLKEMTLDTRDDITFNFEPFTLLNEDIPEGQCKKAGIFFGAYQTRQSAFERIDRFRITIDVRQARIKTSELLIWFEHKGIKPEFFFPEAVPEQPLHNPQYQYRTRLMNIMEKAMNRYYGDNFDIDDKDSYPTQQQIIEWLKSEFSLSKRQAESIEIVISPRGENFPKANNS